MKEGDIIVCVDNKQYRNLLTVGKYYTIIENNDREDKHLLMLCDNGGKYWFKTYRFITLREHNLKKLDDEGRG